MLYKKHSPSLVVIKGRRRIGKSRLVQEFAGSIQKNKFWSFAGLAPSGSMTDQDQRNHFARQLATHLKTPPMTFLDWSDAFSHLSLHLRSGDIVLLDEISWMGDLDDTFISKIKTWWDQQTTHVMLVICGSVSTWIEENILKSTALFGRIHLSLTLEPLSIRESSSFLKELGVKLSQYDIYKLLSVVGGVPWYLEQIHPELTADQNLMELAFKKDSILVTEFDRIFHDLFSGKGTLYKKILLTLKNGMCTLAEIRTAIKFPHSGTLSQMVEHLMSAGFVTKHTLWSFKTEKSSKQSLYRIADPYLRFYLKLIEPNLAKIGMGTFSYETLRGIPGFEAHLGLQIEQLLLQNRSMLLSALGIPPMDICADGPYRQNPTVRQEGCQIDYLVHSATHNLFICEFKFKKRELGMEVVSEIKEKSQKLKVPRGFAKVPVLFHLGGVSDQVETDSFFYRIIDIADFL